MSTTTSSLPELFKSLADPTRLRLLRALRLSELGVGELSQVLGMAQSGISRHLGVLKSVGLVQDRRAGTSNLYRLPEPPGEGHASEIWPLVAQWLDDVPEGAEDAARVRRVLANRVGGASATYFQEVAPSWDSIRAAQYGEDLRHLALLELVPRDLVVLDVGTGTGFMLLGLAERAARLLGVDQSEAMLEKARSNLAAAGVEGADLRLGAMESLPVESGVVDVVLANMSLHHAAEPVVALREMARVLRPGGRVVLTDLARHELEWTREELADEWPGFAPDELEEGLRTAGLRNAFVRTIGTCNLSRSGSGDGAAVDVLLATAVKPE